jgi:hypothetical protein
VSRVNQILIWVTLSILALSLTTVYFWPKPEIDPQIEPAAANTPTIEEVVKMTDLVVTVLNGSLKDGMAKNVQTQLETKNIYVTRIGNAPNRNYQKSEIIYHPEAYQAARELAELLKVTKLTPATSFESRLFATLVLGADFQDVPAIATTP